MQDQVTKTFGARRHEESQAYEEIKKEALAIQRCIDADKASVSENSNNGKGKPRRKKPRKAKYGMLRDDAKDSDIEDDSDEEEEAGDEDAMMLIPKRKRLRLPSSLQGGSKGPRGQRPITAGFALRTIKKRKRNQRKKKWQKKKRKASKRVVFETDSSGSSGDDAEWEGRRRLRLGRLESERAESHYERHLRKECPGDQNAQGMFIKYAFHARSET